MSFVRRGASRSCPERVLRIRERAVGPVGRRVKDAQSGVITVSRDAFEELAKTLGVGPVTKPAHPTQPQRMNANSFCVRNRLFAIRIGGDLVLRLPPARVADLIGSGVGRPHNVGRRPMKDRVLIPAEASKRWTALARESLDYARTTA